jgi:hypothetical protein
MPRRLRALRGDKPTIKLEKSCDEVSPNPLPWSCRAARSSDTPGNAQHIASYRREPFLLFGAFLLLFVAVWTRLGTFIHCCSVGLPVIIS